MIDQPRTRRDDIEEDLARHLADLRRLPIHWTEGRDAMHAAINDLLCEWESVGA